VQSGYAQWVPRHGYWKQWERKKVSVKGGVAAKTLARGLFKPEQPAAPATVGPDVARFETLFLRHYSRVHRLLRRLLGSDEEAEDAAQEVFLRLYRQETVPEDEVGQSRWLLRVATNVGLNVLRSGRRQAARLHRTALLDQADAPRREERLDPAAMAVAQEELALVHAILDDMPARARACLLLRHGGMSYAEIADALGVAPGSVGTMLARAERDFRRRYDELEQGRDAHERGTERS
jgi:RNA polymerase sigma-70 factor, ECF subfamily